ncbi:hypothetical protein [Rhizobium sp. Leaf262]|uniref:hypothetical protein n=1 Tax=Rhizobium sp. Leaf262 TaxID=1736312 RepID=UPI000714F122|nr:hypothetical protein [Rhizobium sp. Leaf262]KQO79433.1 hypothetical protein ASF29_23265 [Rhizobium sp. Leaf262]
MGPNVNFKKKDDLPDWLAGAVPIEDGTVGEALPEWLAGAVPVQDEAPSSRFTEDQINVNYEAPASVRFEVGALVKPEDRLRVLQKHYPDAEPYGDGNFIMTHPENGEVMLYNQEGWIPSAGDFASVVPEAAEVIGAAGGGIFGGLGGAAAGTAVPGVGTVAGGVGGAMTGAGAGGATAKDLAERGINWWFGNEDTRTLGEYAKDKAIDAAMSAAGEGAGMVAAKAGQAIAAPIKARWAGKAMDDAAAKQLAKDFADEGIKPTAGTITQNPKTLRAEANIAARNPHSRVAETQDAIDRELASRFEKTVEAVGANSDPAALVGTTQSAGEGLVAKAQEANRNLNQQRDTMYSQLDSMVGSTPSAGGSNTQALLAKMNTEKKAFGDSAKINKGPLLDDAIRQTKAAAGDLKKGISFRDAQEMRSAVGKRAFDRNTDPYLAGRYKQLYEAVTNDMAETAKSAGDEVFKAWKEADSFNASLYGPNSPKEAVKGLTKAADPEAAFSFLTQKVKQGGTRIKAAREQIERVGGAAQWDETVGVYMNRIGTHPNAAGESVFSPGRFLQEWKKIAPEAKDELFAGARQTYRQDLDKLARMVEARSAASKVKGRLGSEADNLLTQAFRTVTAPVSAGKRVYMDRLLTDSRVVKWMTGIPQAQMTKGGIRDHISWLRNFSREALRAGTDDSEALHNAINNYLADSGIEDQEK